MAGGEVTMGTDSERLRLMLSCKELVTSSLEEIGERIDRLSLLLAGD